jgi:hypothetical protein
MGDSQMLSGTIANIEQVDMYMGIATWIKNKKDFD